MLLLLLVHSKLFSELCFVELSQEQERKSRQFIDKETKIPREKLKKHKEKAMNSYLKRVKKTITQEKEGKICRFIGKNGLDV